MTKIRDDNFLKAFVKQVRNLQNEKNMSQYEFL